MAKTETQVETQASFTPSESACATFRNLERNLFSSEIKDYRRRVAMVAVSAIFRAQEKDRENILKDMIDHIRTVIENVNECYALRNFTLPADFGTLSNTNIALATSIAIGAVDRRGYIREAKDRTNGSKR